MLQPTTSTPVSFMIVLLSAVVGVLPAAANPDPNDPAYRYEAAVKNAGRSPLPQPREVFPAPLAFETETALTPDVPATGVVAWRDAPLYVGGDAITVEGDIVDTYQIRNDSGEDVVCRLQFARYKDDPKAFYIALFSEAAAGLPEPAAEYFLGKTIRVTGPVTTHRNQANIEIRTPGGVEVIGP